MVPTRIEPVSEVVTNFKLRCLISRINKRDPGVKRASMWCTYEDWVQLKFSFCNCPVDYVTYPGLNMRDPLFICERSQLCIWDLGLFMIERPLGYTWISYIGQMPDYIWGTPLLIWITFICDRSQVIYECPGLFTYQSPGLSMKHSGYQQIINEGILEDPWPYMMTQGFLWWPGSKLSLPK